MTIRRVSFYAFAVVCTLAVCLPSRAAGPLFPTPLHLVRRIDDPLAGHTVTVDEYCAGDRIVSVSGPRTTIVDYSRQEIIEIDHRAATYSIIPFDDVARARPAQHETGDWKITPVGVRASSAGRSLDSFELVARVPGGMQKIEAGIDRRITLSRAAAEALIGAAYPGRRSSEHDALLTAAVHKRESTAVSEAFADEYGLISDQTTTFQQEGLTVVVKNSVTAVDSATVSPDALLIDPGAKRVESRLTGVDKELQDIDRLPSGPRKP